MRISIGTEFTMQSYAVSALADCLNEFPYRIKIISGSSQYVGSPSFNMLRSKYMKWVLKRRRQPQFTSAVQLLERKKFAGMYFQSFHYTEDILERGISQATLNLTDIGKMHPCSMSKFFLGNVLGFSYLSEFFSKLLRYTIDVHYLERYSDDDYISRDDKS